jgi:DNA-binding NarL/FixJ family response regulator
MGEIINVLLTTGNDEDRDLIITTMTMQDDIRIIGVEDDEAGMLIKAERLKPDVLIIDLQPPGIDAPALAPIIHRRSPGTSIIIICDRDENDYAGTAIRAGISGYLLRNTDMNKILPAVKIVSLGGYYISASITLKAINTITLMKKFPGQFLEIKKKYPVFSSTERNIVEYIAQGLSDDEIANNLNLSTGTIRNCMAAIKHKTKQKNRIQAVIFSLVHGLVNIDDMIFQVNA